jgi:cytosine/adenosine deaminase-related metal-dependent hydrolase
MATFTIRARWVFPVAGPPLPEGTVTVEADRIAAVEPAGARTADIDLGNAAVLPGLVNAHTHLDLSGMRGLAPPTPDFTAWLRQVIAHRRRRTPEQLRIDIRAGVVECLRFGSTLVGDISGDGTSWDVLAFAPLRAVIFRELLGLPEGRFPLLKRDVFLWRRDHSATESRRAGLSPHAPYSVSASIIKMVASSGMPLSIHLAESAAEMELLAHRRGPFVAFLQELGVWEPSGLVPDIGQVLKWARRAPNPLYVHGTFLDPDIPFLARGTIIYCPRTHAAFGHPPHPFRDFLARGVRVALGTDGLASNPDLDLLAEARFVRRRHPDVAGDVLLHMATLAGAEALGWADETGSLEPGKSADFVVLPLPDRDESDPHNLLFDSELPVRAVLFRGQWRGAGL